jgi:hypothetical protein
MADNTEETSTTQATDESKADEKKDDKAATLTLEQLKERLDRASTAARNKLLKDLGYESFDALKESLGELSNLRTEKLSEKEKQEKKLADALEQIKAHEAKVKKLESERAAEKLDNQLIRAAQAAGVNLDDIEDVVLPKLHRFLKAEEIDTGTLKASQLAPFFDDLKKSKPVLFGQPGTSSSGKPEAPAQKSGTSSGNAGKLSAKEIAKMATEKPAEYQAYIRSAR